MTGHIQNIEGEPVVIDAAVAQAVAAQVGRGMKLPVENFLPGKGRGHHQAHILGRVGKFAVELFLRRDQLLARVEKVVLGLDDLAQVDFTLDQGGESPEMLNLFFLEFTGVGIDEAEGPDFFPARPREGNARVKSHVRLADDHRMVPSDGMKMRVGNDERLLAVDRILTEGDVAMGFRRAKAVPRLEPLAVAVDEGDIGDGHLEEFGGQARDAVETVLGRGIEKLQGTQIIEAFRFLDGIQHGCHGQVPTRAHGFNLTSSPAGDKGVAFRDGFNTA